MKEQLHQAVLVEQQSQTKLTSSQQKDLPRAKIKNRARGTCLARSFLILAMLFIGVVRGQVCGDQSWYHGWLSDFQIVYQVMEVAPEHNFFAIGGQTYDPNAIAGVDNELRRTGSD